ncbi:MAG: TIGR00282 family metallophosphoesterase [Endomicrobium sp.]|jgi:metallophosphoesterase (TIGR00282 family)|nr:TIGR00282 family metallophosphoesterase [Endomicrobium sp.]
MKLIFISDIVGQLGRNIVKNKLPDLIAENKPDIVIANAENAAGGKGLTPQTAKELFECGINVITLGNHAFDRHEVFDILGDCRVLRPANYPQSVAGKGYGVFVLPDGKKIAVINLIGRVHMPITDCPFAAADRIIEKVLKETKNIFVDFHAEATSEKNAMGLYLDGRVSAIVGTHTHIPTADERVLPKGTAYITDAGMTGPSEGVIGTDAKLVIQKFVTGIHKHFVLAKGKSSFQGCIIETGNDGKALSIKRFSGHE